MCGKVSLCVREFKNVGVCVYVLGKRICVFVVFVFALAFIVSFRGEGRVPGSGGCSL